jgi:hypothetical protein
VPIRTEEGAAAPSGGFEQVFGIPSPPPAPPVAPPTLGTAPTVSSTPGAGQGVALDAAGRLAVVVSFLAVVTADPSSLRQGQFWYRADTSQFCVCIDGATVKRVTLA